ncbi:MAG TPA: NADH-quinone oxidoreductase subunit A [Terriglobales bacterium]|jgi:NADH-quinone oxidoreductase subunit A|nr:NADH-quinone oxidoreductase subunit A [Terriglobales bacterium]
MPENYFARYVPLLLQGCVALLIAGAMVTLSWLLGKHRPSRVKLQPYECGITPTGDARQSFSVKFYLVAMLFILFDVEAVFLYPWAVIFRELKMFGFWEMLVYIGIVLVGFFYVWKKGVLDWAGESRSRSASWGANHD